MYTYLNAVHPPMLSRTLSIFIGILLSCISLRPGCFSYFSFCEQSLHLEFKVGASSASALMTITLGILSHKFRCSAVSLAVNEDLGENKNRTD